MAIVGSFGPCVFQVSMEYVLTWRSYRASYKAQYASHDVLEGKPKLQFQGLNLIDVDLSIQLHAGFVDPADELAQLKDMLASASAYLLILGGAREGRFVLTDIEEDRLRTDGEGLSLFSNVSLKLKEYR